MRVRALIIIVALAALFGTAHAEKVKANQSTKVFSRPGEQAKVVLKVKSGQGMTVIGKEGRWLKVRVQGRTGYVARSTVDMPDDDEIVRNTRRRPFVDGRGTKRGFGGDGGPDDRVGADATGDGQDDKSAEDETPKKPKKASDDEEDAPKKPKKASSDDEEDAPKKPKKHGDDEEDAPKKPKKASSDDEEDAPQKPKGDDDEAKVTDDDGGGDKTDERPMAHVSSKTKVFAERDEESEAQFTARPTDILYPTDTKGKWTMVENEEGDAGWVKTTMLDSEEGGGGSRKRTMELRARGGVSLLSQGMRSAGGTVTLPDNYNVSTSAIALAIGGAVLVPYGKDYVLGGDLAYDLSKAVPGIFYDPDGPAGPMPGSNIGITLHNLNVRLLAGYDFHKKNGMTLFARLGYHYQAFQVSDVADFTKNTAKLPQEVYKAPSIGVAIAMPQLTDKIGIRFSLDAVLAGASVTQTKNLEDGADPSAKSVDVGGLISYKWQKTMSLQGTYDLNYASYSFGAAVANSMRGHTGTGVGRTDIFHTITFGIAYGF
ncbi:MAG: hypothetical protein JWO36_5702 [Myxococcales bacterium]|nr:hypothetical protein [Myxococcales bacterium]